MSPASFTRPSFLRPPSRFAVASRVACAAAVLALSAGPAAADSGRAEVAKASVPDPTVDIAFDGSFADSAGGSTVAPAPSCNSGALPVYTPCVSSSSFGTNLDGSYWSWNSTSTAGGGLRVTTTAKVGTTYTMAIKFSLGSVGAGTNGYSKIVDYRNRASDDGFYFQFGQLKYYPGTSTSAATFTNNSTLDLVTVRQATGTTAGTFTVYMVGADKKLVRQFVYEDTSGASIPHVSGAGNLFGFFFDDADTPKLKEASPSGRVYGIRIWANTALSPQTVETAVVPPARPVITSVVPGNASGQVTWGAVTGATSYTATAEPGGRTCTVAAPATTCSIASLVNGTTYSIAVVAASANGASEPSDEVETTPRTTPAAPTDLLADDGNGEATIVFTEGDDGGSAITNHEYSTDGSTWTPFSPAEVGSPVIVPGLSNGTPYTIRLRAVNAAGAGAASDPVTVTPTAGPALPDAPVNLVATRGDRQASVAFTPGNDGGSAIVRYEYSFDGGRAWTAFSPAITASPAAFTGLVNGTEYELVLRAVSAVGNGDASEPVVFTPATVPGAPVDLVGDPGDRAASVTFALGADGGSEILNLEVSIDGGPWKAREPDSLDSPVEITGLTNGRTHQVRLRVVNAVGPGAASDPVSVKPVTVPDPPARLALRVIDDEVAIAYVDGDDGGSPITKTQISINDGPWRDANPVGSGSAVTAEGLDATRAMTVVLRSVNAVGASKSSNPLTVSPETVAAAEQMGSLPATGSGYMAFAIAGLMLLLVGAGLRGCQDRSASRPHG